jgi:hypothetical protein
VTTIIMQYRIPVGVRLRHAQSMHVPADLIIVCLWALTGLIVTALVGIGVGSEELAGILAAAE